MENQDKLISYTSMTDDELRAKLHSLGLNIVGERGELIERLIAHDETQYNIILDQQGDEQLGATATTAEAGDWRGAANQSDLYGDDDTGPKGSDDKSDQRPTALEYDEEVDV
uniref:SAP domain-containing protein n=1 Tax=Bracon brevicornis TaxID=1563983 RepID=A0A6V7KQR4_9HYME